MIVGGGHVIPDSGGQGGGKRRRGLQARPALAVGVELAEDPLAFIDGTERRAGQQSMESNRTV